MLQRMEDERFQQLAQQRTARAKHKHLHPVGFDTDVVCWWENEDSVRCDILPEFHVEQLDGDCFMTCREHGAELILTVPAIPLEKFGKRGN